MNLHYLVEILYIISFSLFIYGLMGLTGPRPRCAGT
ncbi:NAD(P) transhydrogenase subunit beta PntB [Mycobacterium tuberculosis variant bovis BCG]|nr:NAD(P) transhydrogenase subunit beta PntB [Mycobacterium tuberculosis]AMC48649.1 NAD(P) transhydrogenase subunit beta PntB [Mycobacterium tuberculosis variant bovis BCG]